MQVIPKNPSGKTGIGHGFQCNTKFQVRTHELWREQKTHKLTKLEFRSQLPNFPMPYRSYYDSPSWSHNNGQSTILKSVSGNVVSSPGGSEESFDPFLGQPMFGGVGQGAPLNEHGQYIYSKVGMPVVPSSPQSVAYGRPTVMTSRVLETQLSTDNSRALMQKMTQLGML